MTKAELEDKLWPEFIVWCADSPGSADTNAVIWWIDHHFPTVDNFWEWVAKYRVDDCKADL